MIFPIAVIKAPTMPLSKKYYEWNGNILDKEWEENGFIKIHKESPKVCKEILLLSNPAIAYSGHRTIWAGIYIGKETVLVPDHSKNQTKEKPISEFSHWMYISN